MELIRVTEAAALAAGRWFGKGDKNAADQVHARSRTHADMAGPFVRLCSWKARKSVADSIL